MGSINDRWHGAHCPVCVQDDWIHHRVMNDGHKLLQLWVIVQIVLQNTWLKPVSKAYILCMDIGSNFVRAIAGAVCLTGSSSCLAAPRRRERKAFYMLDAFGARGMTHAAT
jgi:Zn ribbon nucleic-acid-binding protein